MQSIQAIKRFFGISLLATTKGRYGNEVAIPGHPFTSGLGGTQSLVNVGDDVIDIFNTDGKADKIGRNTRGDLFFRGELLMGRRCGVYYKGFGIADICEMRQELDVINELFACIESPFDSKADNCPCPLRQILLRIPVIGMIWQSCVIYPSYKRMIIEPLGDLLGIAYVSLHPDMESFEPLQNLEGIEGRDTSTDVAQQRQSHLENIREIAESFPVPDSMVGRIRLGKFGKPAIVPGEGASVHHGTADARAVAADEFGEGVYHDVCSVLEGLEQIRCGNGIIHDKRDTSIMGHFCYGFEIIHVVLGIANGFRIDKAGIFIDCPTNILRVRSVDEFHINPQLGKGVVE